MAIFDEDNVLKYDNSFKDSEDIKKNIIEELNPQSQNISKKDILLEFFKEWKGVKYKLGGYSKNGIDCSALVQKALGEKFDLEVPRDTRSQILLGKTIKKSELEVGDLVFFKTGRTRHVGIYIDEGKFIHASTKVGVTISKLDNEYFKKRYWKSQRVLD